MNVWVCPEHGNVRENNWCPACKSYTGVEPRWLPTAPDRSRYGYVSGWGWVVDCFECRSSQYLDAHIICGHQAGVRT